MAPEQAAGDSRKVGPAVDIYALGVILYQLLTGRTPFRAESPAAVLRVSASDPPVAPRRINRRIPRDLDTIVLKSIEKDPAHRYRTASALGEDLRRFLAREPIHARPPRVWERLLKWARRQPGLAALAASLALVTAFALAGLTTLWLAAERANVLARRSGNAERRARYRADITAAAAALQLNQTETARRLLEASPGELRNWEWRYLTGQLDNSLAAFKPPHAPPAVVLISPDCTRVLYAAGGDSVLHLRDVIPGREVATLVGHEAEVQSIAWSKDGSRVASSSADATLRLWDGTTGQPIAVLRDHARPVVKMYSSADASRLAIRSTSPDVQVWNLAHRTLQSTLRGANESDVVTFSPDGKRLAFGGRHRVRLWDVDSGVERPPLSFGNAAVFALAFSRDGARLAAGTDYPQNRVWLWETATGRLLATMDGHTNIVCGVEFSPDGRRIVSTSFDQTVRLWDGATGQSISRLQGHAATVTGASFHPDGRHLVSASLDGTLRLWDTHAREFVGVFLGETDLQNFALSRPDGSLLGTIGSSGSVHIWNLDRVKSAGVLGRHASFVYDVAFSPSGRQVASAGWDGAVRLWDPQTNHALQVLNHHPVEIVHAIAFHPDGRRLASVARDRRIRIWDLATGQSSTSAPMAGGPLVEHRVAFAPYGNLAASTGGQDGSVQLFTTSGGSPPFDLVGPGAGANDVAFSPDGSRLVCGYSDGSIRIWDVPLRTVAAELHGHAKSVVRVAWSADGSKLASASFDSTARLWDARSFSSIAVLKHPGVVFCAAFDPQGSRLATGCIDNIVRLWDTETSDEVIELRGHSAYVHAVAFSPDGTMLVSGSGDWTVRIWDSRSPGERQQAPHPAPPEAPSGSRQEDRSSGMAARPAR